MEGNADPGPSDRDGLKYRNAELEELLWQAEVMQDSLSDELEAAKADTAAAVKVQKNALGELATVRDEMERLEEEVERLQRALAAAGRERRRSVEMQQRDVQAITMNITHHIAMPMIRHASYAPRSESGPSCSGRLHSRRPWPTRPRTRIREGCSARRRSRQQRKTHCGLHSR